ncbi:SCO family protein [Tumebacillus permanentifrigoris]|uniref:Protein SCO1/2 n=1 Tax=Tumebacillus permanentifrigoris TaxID=378543 RepID=A0A316DXW2_9BACL|nr:SCO family protein [Tumebacillus permanentifrigoris]PWK14951.1 protein SCO1/2 [Tumebacillus permanentifrigoris]
MLKKYWFPVVASILALTLLIGIGSWFWWGYTRLDVLDKPPDFTLQNLDAQPVSMHSMTGKVRVVEFFYANCPDICPLTTANMVTLQKQLKAKGLFGSDVEFVSISFDPDRDSVEVLRQYADRMGIDQSGWVILHGTQEQTFQVANDYGVLLEKNTDGSFTHSTRSLYLVDRTNNVRGQYQMGADMPTDKVLDDILNLVKDKKY